jgi:hypothetical protein
MGYLLRNISEDNDWSNLKNIHGRITKDLIHGVFE